MAEQLIGTFRAHKRAGRRRSNERDDLAEQLIGTFRARKRAGRRRSNEHDDLVRLAQN